MKRITGFIAFAILFLTARGQGLVKTGDDMPDYNFTTVINAPFNKIHTNELKGKPMLIAFWGTWCAPCVPEMIELGKLQRKFGAKVQFIAVSNDDEPKLRNFLKKRPSKIWFASDASQNLWSIFGINSAGHTALINKTGKVVSVVETHLIDSATLHNLVDDKPVALQESRGDRVMNTEEEPIALDSSTLYSFTLQLGLKGIAPMMRKPTKGPFAGRRITIINLPPLVVLKEAFDISSLKRLAFSSKEDSVLSVKDPLCVDIIVPEESKGDLSIIFQKELANHLPVKGTMEQREMDCYVLRPIAGQSMLVKQSSSTANTFSFNGLSFEGEGIPFKIFVGYLENTLDLPVYDDTGFTNRYDINFSRNNIEPVESTRESLAKLGLALVKEKREMDVLIISGK